MIKLLNGDYMTGMNSEVLERIFNAANSLYEECGRADFPTVDAVRKAAKVNMNDASAAMKQWRRSQTAQAAPVVAQVPDSIADAVSQAMAAIWKQAQELANDSLRSAQAGWEAERQELDVMREQLASAFEEQGEELKGANARIVELERLVEQADAESVTISKECDEAKRLHAVAEGRANELAQRAGDLRSEVDRAYSQAEVAREELSQARSVFEKEKDAGSADRLKLAGENQALKIELASLKSKVDSCVETISRLNNEIDVIRSSRDSDISVLKEEYKEEHKKQLAKADTLGRELSSAKELIAELRGKLSILEKKPKGKA